MTPIGFLLEHYEAVLKAYGLEPAAAAVKQKLNIDGWTVTKSGKYYRAFRKINGKVCGVHLGANLDGASAKIMAKVKQLSGKPET